MSDAKCMCICSQTHYNSLQVSVVHSEQLPQAPCDSTGGSRAGGPRTLHGGTCAQTIVRPSI